MEIIIWLSLSALAGVIASNKGRSGFGFFILSVFLSPLIGIIAALIAANAKDIIITSEGTIISAHKKCPWCAESIKVEAIICRYCGRDIVKTQSEAENSNTSNQTLMEKYNITYEGDQYIYQRYRYAQLSDAISYAKMKETDVTV